MAKSTAVAKREADSPARGLERLVAQGDLGKLTPEERVQYYAVVCESLGLNPLTRPFDYLTLQGKTILYARKDCTDQLRSLRKVSVTITSRERIDDVYAVTARATMPDGRTDESVGAVSVGNLRGDALANALMKSECVPLDTEILTRRGFITHDKLVPGEEVLAYDCARDVTEWVPLENVTVYESAPVSALHTDKGQFRVVCTPNHSWAVRKPSYRPDARGDGERGPRGAYRSRGQDRFLIEAQQIRTGHGVILAAPCADADDSCLSPIEAAVLGWVVTDGTIKRVGNSVRLGICQSKEKHKPAIRQLVSAAANGQVKEFVSAPRVRTFPMSGRTYATKAQHWWYLPAAISRGLLARAGFTSRADLPRIVTRLGSEARQAMLDAMMAAEATERGTFANTDAHIMEAFQILCALQGVATGALHTIKGPCYTQRLKKTRHVSGNFLNLTPAGECAVWCPTTRHGTWVMRQAGQVAITGNTKAKRRVTLSICGLGILDETEIETTSAHHHHAPPQVSVQPRQTEALPAPQVRHEAPAQQVAEDVARQTNGRVMDPATPRPMGVTPSAKISKAQLQLIEGLLKRTGVDAARFCQAHKIMTITDLTQAEFAVALGKLESRERRMAEEARQAEEDPDGVAEREAIEAEA